MEPLVLLVVLVILIGGGFFVFQRLFGSDTARRAARVMQSRLDENPAGPARREPSVENLLPGDAVSFSDGTDAIVQSVLECREQVGPRTTGFRWSVLDGGRLLEWAPDATVLYTTRTVAPQGGELFQQFVASPAQGGILKTFEARVQAGTAASNPVSFEREGETFHLRSTGAFTARVLGGSPGEVLADVLPNADENVYFEAEAQSGAQLLGVWTTHILLLVGHPVGRTDIEAIYPGSEA